VSTLQQAEARALAAEAEVRRLEGRLKDQGEYYDRIRKTREEGFIERTADIRVQLDSVHREARAQQTEAARVAGELEAAQAEIVGLKAKLKPPAEEPAVVVRWTRDADPAGHQIAGRVYKGRGPRVTREPLRADSLLVPFQQATRVQASGDVQAIPEGAAEVLRAAGYVVILGLAGTQLEHAAMAALGERPRTAAQMRKRAAELEQLAADLEQIEQREAAQAGAEGR